MIIQKLLNGHMPKPNNCGVLDCEMYLLSLYHPFQLISALLRLKEPMKKYDNTLPVLCSVVALVTHGTEVAFSFCA